MKTGFRTAGFAAWELGPTLEEIRLIGYDSVELCLEHPGSLPGMMNEVRIRRVAKMLEEIELALSSVSYHGDGSAPEDRERKLLAAVDIARGLGASVLVMNAGAKDPARPDDDAVAAARLGGLLEKAEKHGIDVAVEPEPGLLIGSSADFERVARKLGSPRLKLNLDVGHAYLTDPDVAQTIRRLAGSIVHTHIEDIAGRVHKHLLPGEGEMDLRAIIAALRDSGFGGYLTIDLFDLGPEPGERARQALQALQAVGVPD